VTIADGTLTGAGGLELYQRRWTRDDDPRAQVVITHGAGEHLGRYEHVAERLERAGYEVHAYDHRGHGRSQGRRADIGRMDDVVADLRAVVALSRAERPERKLFLLGHSMGGCIALEYALRHQDEIDGLILSSPIASLNAASALTRALSKAVGSILPRLGVYDVDPRLVSRDPEVVHAYETDPLVHHGKVPARTVGELTRSVESFPGRLPGLTVPLLVFHGRADGITEPAGSERVHSFAGSADKEIILFDDLYHETMNERERDQVLDRVIAWLDARADSA
jgi:alpha-beta hydrolase superfamily lysophospholipase